MTFFGGYDPEYPRNAIIRKGWSRLGFPWSDCRVDGRRKVTTRYPVLAARYIGAKDRQKILFVPDFRHKDVPLAWLLSRLSPGVRVVFDPLVSRYETRVLDRGDVDADSTQAKHNRNIDRVSMRLADIVLADTASHAEFYTGQFGLDPGRVRTLHIGFDDEMFRRSPLPEGRTEMRVLFYGSYLPLHGVETIVGAARRLAGRPVSFTLVGKGQTYAAARRAAGEAPGAPVEFVERVEPAELGAFISRFDVVLGIFGTTPKTEMVIPNKVFQSLAVGRPVITASTPAVGELFKDGEELLTVRAGDADALASALETLRIDRDLRQRISQRGSDLVWKEYNPERIAARLASILKETGLAV